MMFALRNVDNTKCLKCGTVFYYIGNKHKALIGTKKELTFLNLPMGKIVKYESKKNNQDGITNVKKEYYPMFEGNIYKGFRMDKGNDAR